MVLSAASELSEFTRLYDAALVKDKWFCCVSHRWFQSWCEYSGFDVNGSKSSASNGKSNFGDGNSSSGNHSRPGPIDNKPIVDISLSPDCPILKQPLTENVDFSLLNSAAYDFLCSEYGGGPAIKRQVITIGMRAMEQIELYPAVFWISHTDEKSGEPIQSGTGTRRLAQFSLHSSLKDLLLSESSRIHNSPSGDGRVWIKQDGNQWKLVPEFEVTNKLEHLDLPVGSELLLEYKRADGSWSRTGGGKQNWRDFAVNDTIDASDTMGKWYESTVRDIKNGKVFIHFAGWSAKWDEWIPVESDRLAARNTHTTGPYDPNKNPQAKVGLQRQNSVGKPTEKGAVGFRNLGNTCFMNSTLQCLANTPFLTEYFVDGRFMKHINRDNPLGWQGKIADEYGSLMKEIWSGDYSTVAPRAIKQAIGEFQPRFSGFQQHDSSELLSFLLDGLHEDLNLVRKKPPTTQVESNGRPDSVVAKESWNRHLLRNNSVIVDTCQGQLKSRVVCPDCSRESITFDPFMFLSVPLPLVAATTKSQEIVLIKSAALSKSLGETVNQPLAYVVKVPKGGSGLELKDGLCRLVPGLKAEHLVVTEAWEGKINRVFGDDTQLDRIGSKDLIVAYEIPELQVNVEAGKEKFTTLQVANFLGTKSKKMSKYLSIPVVIAIPTDLLGACPYSVIRDAIARSIRPLVKGDFDPALFEIALVDRGVRTVLADIPNKEKDSATIDLLDHSKRGGGMAFICIWNEENHERLINSFVWHSTATEIRSQPKKTTVELTECIDSFVKEEVLRKDNMWYCSQCKKHQQASKKFDIYNAPPILIIHLKRFTYNSILRDKVDTLVSFPISGLDLSKWIVSEETKEEAIYDLYAVSHHFGGLGGGHYTASVAHCLSGQWYHFDDSSVSKVDPSSCISPSAYILFYRRRGIKTPSSLL